MCKFTREVACAVWLFCTGVLSPFVSHAQVQRGGLVPQTLELAPAGQGESVALAKAYCLDENLPGPANDTSYRTILHGGNSAFIYVGDEKMSLGQALKDGKIRIRGAKSTDPRIVGGSRDRLRLYFENLTTKPVRVVFEKPAALAADDWLERDNRTRFTPETLNAFDRTLAAVPAQDDANAKPSWDIISHKALWQSMEARGVQIAGLRRCLGLESEGEMTAEVSERLRNFEFVSELHLGTTPAWLVRERDSGKLTVLHGGGKLPPEPPKPPDGTSAASSPGDPNDPVPPGELRRVSWEEYQGVYAAQRRKRLENLSRQQGVDFAVLSTNDPTLELFTPSGMTKLNSEEPEKATNALRNRGGRPLIVLPDQTFWKAERGREKAYDQAFLEIRELVGRNAEFYVDHDPERAAANAKARPLVRHKDDVAVYEGGLLDTRGHSLRTICTQHNLTYVHESESAAGMSKAVSASNLVIISAHKNADYRNYLMGLAERGKFKGKALLLGSCATQTDAAFVSELLARSGAHIAIRFGAEIHAKDAAALVNQLGILLRQPDQVPQRLEVLLDKALNALIDKADSPEEEEGFLSMQDFLVQVS